MMEQQLSAEEREQIVRFIDGGLSRSRAAAVLELLGRNEAARAWLREVAEHAVLISELERSEMARRGEYQRMRPHPQEAGALRSGRRWLWTGAVLAMAAALVVVAISWAVAWQRDRAREQWQAVLEHSRGSLQWTGDGGKVISGLEPGARVSGGTLQTLSTDSWAVFRYRDGSRITLAGRAEVVVADTARRVIHLRRGSLSADLQPPQREGGMLLHTPTAEVRVLSTRFDARADETYTTLQANAGRLQVRRKSDGVINDVPEGHRVVVTLRTDALLVPRRPGAPVPDWQAELPECVTHGKWVPVEGGKGRVKAEPLLMLHHPNGPQPVEVVSASVYSCQPAPVELQDASELVLRGRLRRSGRVYVGLTATFPGGGAAGKFLASQPVEVGQGGGDFVLRVPGADFVPLEEGFPKSVAGLQLEDCWGVTCQEDDLGLEVVAMEVHGPRQMARLPQEGGISPGTVGSRR